MCVYSWMKTSRSQSSVLPMPLSARGRCRADLDRVVGQRRRPAVREVALIDQDDLHTADAGTHRAVNFRRRLFHDARQPPRKRLLALVKVNIEARG